MPMSSWSVSLQCSLWPDRIQEYKEWFCVPSSRVNNISRSAVRMLASQSDRLVLQADVSEVRTPYIQILEEALTSLEQQPRVPSLENLVGIVQLCKKKKSLHYAKRLHTHMRNRGLEAHRVLGSFLVLMFVECGSLHDAEQVFDKLLLRSDYSWTALIQGYLECGECQHALNLFYKMQDDHVCPNSYTFQAVVKACITLKCLKTGQEIHAEIAKDGFENDLFVGSTLIDLYAKTGSIVEAREVFNELPIRDVVLWTAMIAGYAEHGFGEEALNCLVLMRQDGFSPNTLTFVCSLKGCSSIEAIDRGHELHSDIAKEGMEGDRFVGNALVDMYSKCGSLAEAQEVFDVLAIRDVVSWTALITGFAEHGLGEEALHCMEQMQDEGVFPNIVTYICSLKACSSIGAIDTGKDIHAKIVNRGYDEDLFIGNALVDMYAKCGLLVEASKIFSAMPIRDEVSWSSLLTGHARRGEIEYTFHLFDSMLDQGIQPDGVACLSVLSACSHAGLIQKGQKYWESMCNNHGISLTLQHYNCMVDLLGRAGRFNDAVELLEKMPFEPNYVTWSTLLGACQKWGNVELGREAFDHAVCMDENQPTIFIVMSNIYVNAKMWKAAKEIDALRARIQLRLEPGRSWIEIGGCVHGFTADDIKHPHSKAIYAKVNHLMSDLDEEKHLLNYGLTFNEVNRVTAGVHSEVLAVACGLINSPEHTPLCVVKNTHMCTGCHAFFTLISLKERRIIICRDASSFHTFEGGKCSCCDCW